jgi:polar amino acid transport system substrate-binding protein
MAARDANRVADLVRLGKVRVALFPPMYNKDPVTGELLGWAVDLARALGARLGVKVLHLEYRSPREVLEDLTAGACDMAFLTIDPSRTAQVDFCPPLSNLTTRVWCRPAPQSTASRTRTGRGFASRL